MAAIRPKIGTRVEIPVHYDLWMQGARFGIVTGFRYGKPGQSDYVFVRLDHTQVKRPLKVWSIDWEYMRDANTKKYFTTDAALQP
jgi:hypothetical protein